ncbi:MAG: hypothetical protein AAGF31_03685 [Planctomycetota bacterium]
MQHEPSELRISKTRAARTRRHEALVRARRVVNEAKSNAGEPAVANATVLDEAFAELPAAEPKANDASKTEGIGGALLEQLSSQLRQLDAQREQLTELLERAKQ